jgi:hypothetical protein
LPCRETIYEILDGSNVTATADFERCPALKCEVVDVVEAMDHPILDVSDLDPGVRDGVAGAAPSCALR